LGGGCVSWGFVCFLFFWLLGLGLGLVGLVCVVWVWFVLFLGFVVCVFLVCWGVLGRSYFELPNVSLNVILAVGYRVKSPRVHSLGNWATTVLHEYLQKGFVLSDDFLKNMGGGVYWKELLERI
jgi:hypothetical protein